MVKGKTDGQGSGRLVFAESTVHTHNERIMDHAPWPVVGTVGDSCNPAFFFSISCHQTSDG
jgi:hypothetical protein